MTQEPKGNILDWTDAKDIFRRYLVCWETDLPLIWAKKAWAACVRNGLMVFASEAEERQARLVPVILSLFYYEYCHRTGWHENRNFRYWRDSTWYELKSELLDRWDEYEDLIHRVKMASFEHIGDHEHAAELWISCLECSQGIAYSKAQRDEAYSKLVSRVWDDFNYQRGKTFVVGGFMDDLDTYESISGLGITHAFEEEMSTSSDSLVARIADRECQRIANKVIRHLQTLKDGCLLSGDDSGLENAWDEICVQVQDEHSFYWDAYLLTIRQAVDGAIMGMSPEIAEAIWLQTEHLEDFEPRSKLPVNRDEVADYIVSEHVLPKAGEWSNERIRNYLEWSSGSF